MVSADRPSVEGENRQLDFSEIHLLEGEVSQDADGVGSVSLSLIGLSDGDADPGEAVVPVDVEEGQGTDEFPSRVSTASRKAFSFEPRVSGRDRSFSGWGGKGIASSISRRVSKSLSHSTNRSVSSSLKARNRVFSPVTIVFASFTTRKIPAGRHFCGNGRHHWAFLPKMLD